MNTPSQSQGQGQSRRKQGQGHGRGRRPKAKGIDLWRPVPILPDPEPIRPANDPTAVLRSLGDPPLPGQGVAAEYYFAAVVERAAVLATALAASAGLLATADPDD